MTRDPRLVVVTGTPRSGTTPVGDALAAAPGARTLYEPLNRHVGDRRVRRYFEVVDAAGFTAATADALVADVRRLRLDLRPGVFPEDRGLRRAVKRVTGSRTRMTYRACRLDPRLATIVWKDPFAAFLAERLAGEHGIPVVVTVRPPHAVAASFKRLGWAFDVEGLITRLGEAGRPHAPLLAAGDPTDPVHNAAVLWRVVNAALLEASRRTPGIHLVDLDAVVADPHGAYRRLYELLDLRWTGRTERHLTRTAGGDGPAAPTAARAHVSDRDTAAVNRYWVDVLEPAEVALVDEVAGDLWRRLRAAIGG